MIGDGGRRHLAVYYTCPQCFISLYLFGGLALQLLLHYNWLFYQLSIKTSQPIVIYKRINIVHHHWGMGMYINFLATVLFLEIPVKF